MNLSRAVTKDLESYAVRFSVTNFAEKGLIFLVLGQPCPRSGELGEVIPLRAVRRGKITAGDYNCSQ